MKTKLTTVLFVATLIATSCQETVKPDNTDDIPDLSTVILNEIDGGSNIIELYNSGSKSVFLDGAKVRRMRILDGADDEQTLWEGDKSATIPAGGYLCLKYEKGKEGGLYLKKKISSKKNISIWLQDAAKKKVSEFSRGTRGSGWNLMHMQECLNEEEVPFSFSYVHGNWVYAQPTPGAANAVKAGDIDKKMLQVVINEIDMAGGKIELYNNGDSPIDLLGLQLRWSRMKNNVADNKTIWECTKSLTIPSKGFIVLDAASSGNTGLDIKLPDYTSKNFHIRLRDGQNKDFTGSEYVYDDLKRGSKGSGWTLETLSTNISNSMARIPDGTGDWFIVTKSSIGATNANSTTIGEVPELEAF